MEPEQSRSKRVYKIRQAEKKALGDINKIPDGATSGTATYNEAVLSRGNLSKRHVKHEDLKYIGECTTGHNFHLPPIHHRVAAIKTTVLQKEMPCLQGIDKLTGAKSKAENLLSLPSGLSKQAFTQGISRNVKKRTKFPRGTCLQRLHQKDLLANDLKGFSSRGYELDFQNSAGENRSKKMYLPNFGDNKPFQSSASKKDDVCKPTLSTPYSTRYHHLYASSKTHAHSDELSLKSKCYNQGNRNPDAFLRYNGNRINKRIALPTEHNNCALHFNSIFPKEGLESHLNKESGLWHRKTDNFVLSDASVGQTPSALNRVGIDRDENLSSKLQELSDEITMSLNNCNYNEEDTFESKPDGKLLLHRRNGICLYGDEELKRVLEILRLKLTVRRLMGHTII